MLLSSNRSNTVRGAPSPWAVAPITEWHAISQGAVNGDQLAGYTIWTKSNPHHRKLAPWPSPSPALPSVRSEGNGFSRMKEKQRYIARMDEVTIKREGETAIIKYKEDGIIVTNLRIGPSIVEMTDEEILDLFNETLRSEAAIAAQHKHVADEIPIGSAQIEYHRGSNQWVPKGAVLRCLIHDNEEGRAVIEIDDRELTLEEFGALLAVYAGWGMRIEFTPAEEVHRRPALKVRERTSSGE